MSTITYPPRTAPPIVAAVRVIRSGFDWADTEWRWLAYAGDSARFYAYAATPERARAELAEVLASYGVAS